MTTYVPAKKNAEFIFYLGLVSQSTGQFQANPTLAAGDWKVSIDGGALNNLATLPAATPASSRLVKVTLSASEMNGDNIIVQGVDAAGSEWDEVIVNIQTSVQQIDDLASQSSVNTIDDFLDTEIAAIKAKTDNLPADPADESNILAAIAGVQADTDNIQTRLPAALSGDGFIKADILSINDELTSGNNATLNLKQLSIINSAGNALLAQSTGGNGHGAFLRGHGAGYGLDILGGDNQSGLAIDNGSTGGSPAVAINANNNGTAVQIFAQNNDALYIESGGVGFKSINAPQDIAVSDGSLTLAAIRDAVWAKTIETGYNALQSMRLMLSALAGKLSGAATTTVTIRNAADSKNRIVATVDSSGNRTAVTHDTSD